MGLFSTDSKKSTSKISIDDYFSSILSGLISSGKYNKNEIDKLLDDAYEITEKAMEFIDKKKPSPLSIKGFFNLR